MKYRLLLAALIAVVATLVVPTLLHLQIIGKEAGGILSVLFGMAAGASASFLIRDGSETAKFIMREMLNERRAKRVREERLNTRPPTPKGPANEPR